MTRGEAWLLWLSTVLAGGSGILLGVMKYLMRSDDPYAVVNHPLQPWVLAVHVISVPALTFALGLLARVHVVAKLRAPATVGRRSGLATALLVVPMVLSGYAIQTSTTVIWLNAAVVVHIASGLGFTCSVGLHLPATWRRARELGRLRRDGRTGSALARQPR